MITIPYQPGASVGPGLVKMLTLKPRMVVNALQLTSRSHNPKKGPQGTNYHTRIQKKWDKDVMKKGSKSKYAATKEIVQMSLGPEFLQAIGRLGSESRLERARSCPSVNRPLNFIRKDES